MGLRGLTGRPQSMRFYFKKNKWGVVDIKNGLRGAPEGSPGPPNESPKTPQAPPKTTQRRPRGGREAASETPSGTWEGAGETQAGQRGAKGDPGRKGN